MIKVIFVGDKPSPLMETNASPFRGAKCEKRLLEWIGAVMDFTWQDILKPYNKKYRVINQVDYGRGYFYALHRHGYKIIALGNNSSKALKGIPHFKLPHPSGRNRQINNKKFVEQKLKEAKEYVCSQQQSK